MSIETTIADCILGMTDRETASRQVALQLAVQRSIFCPDCGEILDKQSAVLIEVSDVPKAVCCPDCFNKIRDRFRARPETRGAFSDFRIVRWENSLPAEEVFFGD